MGSKDHVYRRRKRRSPRLVDQLPENAAWDDLMHEIYVREAVEKGEGSKAGRTKDVKEIRKNTDSRNEGSLD